MATAKVAVARAAIASKRVRNRPSSFAKISEGGAAKWWWNLRQKVSAPYFYRWSRLGLYSA
jgi:hypothetical protein